MAKFLDTIGLTHLIGELDARYAGQFAAIDHEHDYLSSVPLATTSDIGGFKLKAAKRTTNLSSNITTGGTTASRYCGVELDTNGLAFVNVPWTSGSGGVTSGNTSSKLFLVGRTTQSTTSSTAVYSHDTVYVDTNGRLNSRQSESGTTVSTVITAADAMSTSDIDTIFESLV